MEVYYKTNDYELLLGDTLEILKQMSSESVDMIFTSPPYNLDISNSKGDFKLEYDNWEDNMEYEDYCRWQIDILNECYRIVKSGGLCFIIIKISLKTMFIKTQ